MAIPPIDPYPPPIERDLPRNTTNWRLDPARVVLLVHDMQRYFLAAYDQGAQPMTTVLPNIAALRAWAVDLGVPVVYSAQPGDQRSEDRMLLSDFWGPGLKAVPEHEGIVEPLAPGDGDVLLVKWRYSAFQRTDLRDRMRSLGVASRCGQVVTTERVSSALRDVDLVERGTS